MSVNPAWDAYLQLDWTSDNDECEADDCTVIMGPHNYVASWDGNYCSDACKVQMEAEYDSHYEPQEDFHADLGIGPSDPYEPYGY